ncbi:MAG: hypothetical protein V4525_12705 [Pseudomonadota bacterium]
MANIHSIEPVSPNPGIGGVHPDSVADQCIAGNCAGQGHSLSEHTVPGQAGEPGEGNSAPQSPIPGHENSANLEVSPDQLRANASQTKHH